MPHIPVLLNEVLEILDPKPGESFIDATINGGGHARAILERIMPDGKLLGIEWDHKIMENLKIKIENWENRSNITLVNDSYINLKSIIATHHFKQINGILFDLGMSNWHVEESGKGFSFLRDEPLDMRYDVVGNELTAESVVNKYSQTDLERVIKEYGQESFARAISEAIVKDRREHKIVSSIQLVAAVKNGVPFWYRNKRIHFATKTFQALRIEVNHEFENIRQGLSAAIEIAPAGCRIAVITFHSLEDKIVKELFREQAKSGTISLINKKPTVTGFEEIRINPKSRSAKLRGIIKN